MIVNINDTEYELVLIGNEPYYKDRYCKCGCGKQIPYKSWHGETGRKMPVYYSPSHFTKHNLLENPNYFNDIRSKREALNDNEVLIKGEVIQVELIEGTLYYKDRLCECGCGQKIPCGKNHTHNGVPRSLPHHLFKPKKQIDLSNTIEVNGILYYKNFYCECGCGERIKFDKRHEYTRIPRFTKGHWYKTEESLENVKTHLNSAASKEKCSKTLKEKADKNRVNKSRAEEEGGYVLIKGEKLPIEFMDGVKYYSDKICSCGCGQKIPVLSSHRNRGVPEFIQSHTSYKKDGVIIIDGVKCFKNKICNCGCDKNIPLEQGINKIYIVGHKPTVTEPNTSKELVQVDGIYYYKNIYCECGCGERIQYKKYHKYTGMPKYIKRHYLNDEIFMEKLKKNGKDNALKQFSQKGSYGQTGHYYSEKNSMSIPYDSSYELKAMTMLEEDSTVISYNRSRIKIPYYLDGSSHNYFPDFLINDSRVVEVKPGKFINSTKNLIKFSAAESYCSENNLTFEVWTEKELGINSHKRFFL